MADADHPQPASLPSSDFVQSLARGLAVIRAFDGEYPRLSLSDVARRSELTRAAARRFLLTLQSLGYVRSDGRVFELTPRVLNLGFSYLSALSLPEVAQPHLEAMSRELEESVSAAVLDGAQIVYVARVPTRRIMSVRITIGTRFPAYATSMGRVLLAGLTDADLDRVLAESPFEQLTPATVTDRRVLQDELALVREQGWALVEGELEQELRALAVPLRDHQGAVIAAINVSSSTLRGSPNEALEHQLPALLSTARRVEDEIRLVT